jgi:hypothetical protein
MAVYSSHILFCFLTHSNGNEVVVVEAADLEDERRNKHTRTFFLLLVKEYQNVSSFVSFLYIYVQLFLELRQLGLMYRLSEQFLVVVVSSLSVAVNTNTLHISTPPHFLSLT